MKQEIVQLDNGLKTLFVHSSGSRTACVQIWFRAGSALENSSNRGIAHFLEHMFFKGTEKRPGSKLAYDVETYGGEINAFTSFDYTCYYINSPAEHLVQSIDILLDMVSNPRFLEEDLPAEREVVLEEYKRAYDSPGQYSFMRLQKNFIKGAYSKAILGNPKSISSFSLEQIKNFRKQHYNLSNALFIVASNLEATDLKNKIAAKINEFSIPTGPVSKFPRFLTKPDCHIEIHDKDVQMAQITLMVEASPYSSLDSAAEDLAINCLTHGESSTLHKKLVVDLKLANYVSGSTIYFSQGGFHLVKISSPVKYIKSVLENLSISILEIAQKGFDDKDLNKIKNQYIASKSYNRESLDQYTFVLGHGFAQEGNINAEEDFLNKINLANTNLVNSSLKKIFCKDLKVSLQLPKGHKQNTFRKDLAKFIQGFKPLKKQNPSKPKVLIKSKNSKFDKNTKLITLPNNVKLIYRSQKISPTFSLQAYIKGGLSDESSTNNGSYHLMSSILSKGTEKQSFAKMKEELEYLSSSLNGFSGKNSYGLAMHGISKNFERLSQIFLDSLLHPSFSRKIFSLERELALREIKTLSEDPIKQCFINVNKLFFAKHPYSMNAIGSQQSLRSLTNIKLQELHYRNLRNKPLVVTYCGDLPFEYAADYLIPLLSKIKKTTNQSKKIFKSSSTYGQDIQIELQREQTHIFMGLPAYKPGSKQDIFLKMFTTLLSGQSSELFTKVRDELGLCYTVQPVHLAALEGAYWGIYIASSNAKYQKACQAIREIINRYANEGVDDETFEIIKRMTDGQNILSIQTHEDYAGVYSIPVLHDMPLDNFYLVNKKLKQTSSKDFNSFLKSYFSKKFNTVSVGKFNS